MKSGLSFPLPEPGNKKGQILQENKIIFIGDRDFTSLFEGLGFEVFEANSKDDFVRIFESLKKETCLVIVGAKIHDSAIGITGDEIENINPNANVMFLSTDKPDKDFIKSIYRKISERASGVDLTRKL